MKVLRVEPNEYMPKRYTLQLVFDAENGVLSGTVGTGAYIPDNDLILDINLDLKPWVGKLVEVRIGMADKGYEIVTFDALKNYSISNGMPSTPENRIGVLYRLFRVYVKENLDDSIIQIFWGHEALEGFEDITEENQCDLRMYNFVRQDPEIEFLLARNRLKSAMLGDIDQRDSVAYLEAQVDILSRLVIQEHKNSNNPLIELLRKADVNSVLDVKDTDALIEELTEKKGLVREVQKRYYADKQILQASAH